MLSLRSFAKFAVIAGLGCASTACSSLTRPDEITIAAEPAPEPQGGADQPAQPAPARNAAGSASGG